eukprot:7175393-Prymnesium_polylepis.1
MMMRGTVLIGPVEPRPRDGPGALQRTRLRPERGRAHSAIARPRCGTAALAVATARSAVPPAAP